MKRRKRRLPRTTGRERAGILLHQSFQRALERWGEPWPMAADLVVERLKAQGVSPSPTDRRAIEKAFRTNSFDALPLKGKRSGGKAVTVTLTDADTQAIVGRVNRVTKRTRANGLHSYLPTPWL